MQRINPDTVAIVPWYERKDFERLRQMSQGDALPSHYDIWLENAYAEIRELLASGIALKIVTVHLDDYFQWLENEREVDTVSTRSRYISVLAVGSDDEPLQAETPRPGFPTAH